MKVIGMIPCRMNSTRFKGKAIYNILSYPMIYWVYYKASKSKLLDKIYVVTSDKEIEEVCLKYNIPCICNKTNETTALEKIAIESCNIDCDIVINIQGDEPLIETSCIDQIITAIKEDDSLYYVGLKSKIKTKEEFLDSNVVKTVTDKNGFAMYFSRSPIPFNYDNNNAYRVMGLYGYKKEFLTKIKNYKKSELERLEQGIEMLRVMEEGYKIKLLTTSFSSIGVDLKEHIKKVETLMIESGEYGEYTDLYDSNKNKTGKILFRAKGTKLEVPKGLYNIVVLAIIENDNKILFQKTSKAKGSIYALPGGHVQMGETSKEAIIHELKEEMNLNIEDINLFKTYKYETAFKDVYCAKNIKLENINLREEEVSDICYLTKDEILKFIKENKIRKTNIDAINDYLNEHTNC